MKKLLLTLIAACTLACATASEKISCDKLHEEIVEAQKAYDLAQEQWDIHNKIDIDSSAIEQRMNEFEIEMDKQQQNLEIYTEEFNKHCK